MNKSLNIKYIITCISVIGVFLLQSCSSDEDFDVVGSTENKVYINTNVGSPIDVPRNSYLYNVTNTPVGSTIVGVDKLEVKFGVKCTLPASKDIVVSFELDNLLIKEGYIALPSGVTLSMDKTTLTIPKGATISNDSITFSIASDDLKLLEIDSYMVPVRISSVVNAEVSDNLMSAYLIINSSYTNCVDKASDITGTAADRTGWLSTVNGEDQGTALFDNSNGTYYYGENFTLEVDLGSVHENITGFMMDFYAWYYAIGTADIYTSATNKNEYVLQGSPSFPKNSPQYVNFYGNVNARYIKVVVKSPSYNSSYGTAITEFNVYQE